SALPVTQSECGHEPRSTVHAVLHVPPVHVPLHVMPQPPQLLVSLPIVWPHLPLQHLCEPHGVPHPPQLFGSLVMSTHALLQQVLCVPRQPVPHGGPPVSCCVPESCGGVPVSLLLELESLLPP